MCEHLRRYNIIPVLSDILQESVKEKVTRIILAAFRVSILWGVCPVGVCPVGCVCAVGLCVCGVLVCVLWSVCMWAVCGVL